MRVGLVSCGIVFGILSLAYADYSITPINPPEQGFFSKKMSFGRIQIKAPAVVADAALISAYDHVATELAHIPGVYQQMASRGVQVHIIGKDQVTSDLPEFRDQRGVHQAKWNGQTIDERTRGMGGLLCSCGEENLLKLTKDRYRGSDICTHEFSHCIRNFGCSPTTVAQFDARYQAALAQKRWVGSYAGSNPDEFFAELSMWYFGTHGAMDMTGPKPGVGPAGLKAYDPESYALFDNFYQGRIR